MSQQPLRLLILGAHPDDAEFHAGGLAVIYRQLGHVVKMVSVTNGGAGHHIQSGQQLVDIRRAEAAAAGRVIGAEYVTWDFPDGSLLPTLEVREQIIREIRTFRPDLVLTHRTNDYHPDHRAVGQAVQDASYMVTVPLVVADTPILEHDPVVAYMVDTFTKPCPFEPDVIIDIAPHIDTIARMLDCHRSQVYEFLPFNRHYADQVPGTDEEKLSWLRQWYSQRVAKREDRFRTNINSQIGEVRSGRIKFIEAFEISEYASAMDDDQRKKLFPTCVEA